MAANSEINDIEMVTQSRPKGFLSRDVDSFLPPLDTEEWCFFVMKATCFSRGHEGFFG
jgi:hypothetical protein